MTQALQPQIPHKPKLVLVEPTDAFRDHHRFLLNEGNDVVHPISSEDELLEKRLGFMKWSKRCFVVEQGTRILAVNYSHATSPAIPKKESWRVLPGNIDTVLDMPSKPKTKAPTVLTLYSIFNTQVVDDLGQPYKGAARSLIFMLHETFARASDSPIHTTLSPFRTFQGWLNANGKSFEGTREEKLKLVVEHMRAIKIHSNQAQKLHLGNGALVGAIQLDASKKTKDMTDGAGVMINYRYSRDPMRLENNRRLLAAGLIPCDHHLAPYFGS